MIINSHNGWDSLEEIIVGRADFARIPSIDPSMKNFMYAHLTNEEIVKVDKYRYYKINFFLNIKFIY